MNLSQVKQLFSSISYLSSLNDDTLQSLAEAAVHRTFDADQIVFLENEFSSGLYIVQSGWLKAIKIAPDGREQILNFLGPGEVLNAVGVFAGTTNPATVIALESSQVVIIQRMAMLRVLENHPLFAQAVIQDLAGRILHLIQLVEDLSLRTVEARLARLILEQASSKILSRQRWATQNEMAARLGTVPDVINRALRSLIQDGLIIVERHQIQILDQDGLAIRAGLEI